MSLGNRAWALGVVVQRAPAVLAATFPVRGDCCVARLQLALPALAATAGMPANNLILLSLLITTVIMVVYRSHPQRCYTASGFSCCCYWFQTVVVLKCNMVVSVRLYAS